MKTLIACLALLFCVSTASAMEYNMFSRSYEGHVTKGKVKITFQATPEEIWKVIYQSEKWRGFMPRVLESAYLDEKGIAAIKSSGTLNANKLKHVARKHATRCERQPGKVWEAYFFMAMDFPFPVANRWYIGKIHHDETQAAQHIYRRCWKMVEGTLAHAEGCWVIHPGEKPDESVTLYEDNVDLGPKVPLWVSKMGTDVTLPEVFNAMEAEAHKRSSEDNIPVAEQSQ